MSWTRSGAVWIRRPLSKRFDWTTFNILKKLLPISSSYDTILVKELYNITRLFALDFDLQELSLFHIYQGKYLIAISANLIFWNNRMSKELVTKIRCIWPLFKMSSVASVVEAFVKTGKMTPVPVSEGCVATLGKFCESKSSSAWVDNKWIFR